MGFGDPLSPLQSVNRILNFFLCALLLKGLLPFFNGPLWPYPHLCQTWTPPHILKVDMALWVGVGRGHRFGCQVKLQTVHNDYISSAFSHTTVQVLWISTLVTT